MRRRPLGLLAAGSAFAIAVALPALYLLIVIAGAPQSAWSSIWDARTLGVLARTAGLATAVTASAVLLAVPLAWLTARTDLPGRRVWATLTALPLVIPSYIGAYVFVAALGPRGALQGMLEPLGVERLPSIYGFAGAWIVLTLFTFPLVMLTVRAALVRLDPQLEDAARAMGRSPLGTFVSVVLPQLRPAIAAGGLLVALYVLADFGAVSIMRFNSFTREIYISYAASFDRTGAAALAALLVLLTLAVLALFARMRSRLRQWRASPGTLRPANRVRLGPWRLPALGFCALVVLVALLVPVSVLVYWAGQDIGAGAELGRIAANAGNSLLAGSLAAAIAATLAVVVAVLVVRHPGPLTTAIERLSYSGYALPGIVIALALVFFGTRVLPPLYQTLAMLVAALTLHFLPLAIGAVVAALAQVPPRVEEAARGLGRGPLSVFRTVTAPMAMSGVAAGAALVFLHAVKELPATLLLAPIGFETLATDLWRQTTTGFFEAGALPALVLLLVAAPPLYLLTGRGSPA